MEAFAQEGHSSGVAVNAVDGDDSVACEIAVERYVLIGVGEKSTCLNIACCNHCGGKYRKLSFNHLN